MSSAYCRWEIKVHPLFTSKPLNKFLYTALTITPLNPSATSKNKNGANISHYLRPLWTLISSVVLPLTRMDIFPQKIHALIQRMDIFPSNKYLYNFNLMAQNHSYHSHIKTLFSFDMLLIYVCSLFYSLDF